MPHGVVSAPPVVLIDMCGRSVSSFRWAHLQAAVASDTSLLLAGHCKKLAPTWKELAAHYSDNEDVQIADVDCTKNATVCKKNMVGVKKRLAVSLLGSLGYAWSIQPLFCIAEGLRDEVNCSTGS